MVHGQKCKVAFLHVHVITFLSLQLLSLSVTGVVCTVSTVSTSSDSKPSGGPNEEVIRRELVKVQILQRLGLNEKPEVDLAHKISKDLVLEALKRTEAFQEPQQANTAEHHNNNYLPETTGSGNNTGSSSETGSRRNVHKSRHRHNHQSTAKSKLSDETGDTSNYAKTSEIIAFPDKGPELNGHNLLSFSYAGNQAYGLGVRVRKAHLWVKMDYRSSIGRHFGHLLNPRGVTLYVFQVLGNFSHDADVPLKLQSEEVSLEMILSRTLSWESLGWQKLDVTSMVQKWYNKQSRHRVRHAAHHQQRFSLQSGAPANGTKYEHNTLRDKLTLLVDCSGCGSSIHPIIFGRENAVMSPSSPPKSPSHHSSTPSGPLQSLRSNPQPRHNPEVASNRNRESSGHNNNNESGDPPPHHHSTSLDDHPTTTSTTTTTNNNNNNHNNYHLSLEEETDPQDPSRRHHHHQPHNSKNIDQSDMQIEAAAADERRSPHHHHHHHHPTPTPTIRPTSHSQPTEPHIDNFTEIPFLVLETETAPNFKRSRRRAMDCSPRVKHCCKQRFYIDFRDLGWDDWIIAPRGYHANYCRGHCGGLHRTPDTFLNYHTHVIEEYRRTTAGHGNLSGITPCCAPTKFSSMSLIYFGPDLNIIKRDLPKMIVEECGCP